MAVKTRSSVVSSPPIPGSQKTVLFALSLQAGSCCVSISLLLKPLTGSEKLNRTVKGPDTGGSCMAIISSVSSGMVIPSPDTDQPPVPSSLVARTCTW